MRTRSDRGIRPEGVVILAIAFSAIAYCVTGERQALEIISVALAGYFGHLQAGNYNVEDKDFYD
jgi:hypothetical protein